MLAIDRPLMARPALLLLAEPSLGLAPVRVDEVHDDRADRGTGVSVVVVEQQRRPGIRSVGGCGTAAGRLGRIGAGICGPVKAIRPDRGGFGRSRFPRCGS